MVHSPVEKIQTFLRDRLTPDHISALASIFVNVHTVLQSSDKADRFAKVAGFEAFSVAITNFMHELVVEGFVSPDHHGMLLRDMGLHQGCWSLSVMPKVLSLLARVLICRLQRRDDQDDPLSLNIWKGSV